MEKISLFVNGAQVSADVEPRLLLVHLLRDMLNLTGTHVGCDTTSCGACTVIVDGKAIKSCTMFAIQADGAHVMTVEGLVQDGKLHPIQEAFHEEHGLQCGFCTPGMQMTTLAFLSKIKKANPTDEEIRWALSGNLCRCTGYVNIVKAVKHAAQQMYAQAPASVETVKTPTPVSTPSRERERVPVGARKGGA